MSLLFIPLKELPSSLQMPCRYPVPPHYGIHKGILTVYSDEPPSAPLPPEPVDGSGRPRAVNGTISYMPPLFGLMLAGAVIQRLLERL